jgi:hypothetical protein
MASIAAGTFTGTAKSTSLILVTLLLTNNNFAPLSSAISAWFDIVNHATNNNLRGRAVASMSFGLYYVEVNGCVLTCIIGAPKSLLWYPAPTRNPGNTDVFGPFLQNLYNAGIVAVASAGNLEGLQNEEVADLSFHTPRRNGGANTPLIVVGNAVDDGFMPRSLQQLSEN